jgi:hypothetical protein
LAQDEPSERIRRPGAGRKPAICKDPTLLADLEALVEPTTRGDPASPLRWTCKSMRRLAQALQAQGHQVSRTLVAELLNAAGYSLQANSQNWRANPLVSYRVIVELISATTTKTGLTVRCELDTGQYPSGIVVSDAEMAAINLKRAEFHGEWNYTISPNAYPPGCAFIS